MDGKIVKLGQIWKIRFKINGRTSITFKNSQLSLTKMPRKYLKQTKDTLPVPQ